MERYSEYKDSGIYYIPLIPSSWNVLKGKILFKEEKRPIRQQDEIVTCFRDGQVTLRKNRRLEGFTNSLKEIGYKGIRKGDLVIHNMDAFAGAIGVSDSDGKGTPVYAVCTPIREDVNQYYYCFLLRFLAKIGFIQSLAKGIRERSTDFRYGDFKELLLPVPSRAEQDAIVRYLDAATSKIDKAIVMQQKMIDLLNERKQIIIQNAVTKGLDENVEMKDSGVEWIGMIPKHWEILKLKRCASIKTGTTPPTNERKYFDGGRISWFTPGDLNDLHLKFASKTITQKAIDDKVGRLFPAKTIYFVGIGATVAKVSACDFAASSNQQINAIICNESLDYIFATYVLKSEQEFIRNMANYVTLPIINQSDTGLIDMIVPPKSEQQAIVAYLGKEMQRFDSAISNCQRQITLLQERKQIIINEVVTGKVKVS